MNSITIEEAYKRNDVVFIDVRTKQEYDEDCIYGAINIPIFDAEERSKIGYIYKQVSKDEAMTLGLEIASKKLPDFYSKLKEFQKQRKKIVIYCWRGGMRSTSITTVMSLMRLQVFRLEGGYKSYRSYIRGQFNKLEGKLKFIVLQGGTGVGKTDILESLEDKGYPVIDLEGYANHRGSTYGSIGLGEQTSQKQFESILYHKLLEHKDTYMFIEAESSKVGRRDVPKPVYESLLNGIYVHINCSMDLRAKRLENTYVSVDNNISDLIEATSKIKRYLSSNDYENIISHIQAKEFKETAIILLENYYDKLYNKWSKKDHPICTINADNVESAVTELIEVYNKISE
ncbi:tRNA 2-selenouridine(34) synthase MnmH [Clostridium sp. DL1XJH146]